NNNVDTFLGLSHYQNDPPDHVYVDSKPDPAFQRPFAFFESPWTDIDDNFGDEGTGYWVVPATGSYDLWIASDDASRLYMAADAVPAHKVIVASEPNWAGDRVWAD